MAVLENKMIHSLRTQNIGPITQMDIQFGDRLNIITGDNGLGKSFILDLVWWALTRRWPYDVNKALTQGYMARPHKKAQGKIAFSLTSDSGKPLEYASSFDYDAQAWTGKQGRPCNPGLVLYAMADGSFAVWDSARNYWKKKGNIDIQDRQPAYIFSPAEVWDGLSVDGAPLCNGLIRDWASWQKEKGHAYKTLKKLLEQLSASADEQLALGELTRISLDDVRDMPTIKSSYSDEDIPVVYASSAIRRILALAYLLVWIVEEHKRASELLGQEPANYVTFMVDEIEAHLHPKWQRSVIPSLINAIEKLMRTSSTQFIITTHSPLVLTSLEGVFDEKEKSTDAWFDLDFDSEKRKVEIVHRPFTRQGSSSNWLTSEAFDLPTDYSLDKEHLLESIHQLVSNPETTEQDARKVEQDMYRLLSDIDPLWIRWRKFLRSKGWEA